MEPLALVGRILGALPPAAVKGFADMLVAILRGDGDKAQRLARVTAAAVGAKEVVRRRFAK